MNGLFNHQDRCVCRTCRIVVLLEKLPDVLDGTTSSGSRGPGDGAGVPMMSREYHWPAYRELVRVLDHMLAVGRLRQRQHMLGYFEASTRLVDRRVKVRGPHGKLVATDVRVAERLVPSWVRLERVRRGVVFVEGCFVGDPSLPDAFIKTEEAA